MTHRLRQSLVALAATAAVGAAFAQSVEGEVRKVDRESGKITLKHGPIQHLDMPAMSMVFQVKDPAFLEKVAVGDMVVFTADKVNGAYTVTSISKK